MYNQFPLPSLEEIERMEKKRSKAIESVEILDSGSGQQYVKCQKCHNTVPIVGKLCAVKTDEIVRIENRIKRIEKYPYGNNATKENNLRMEREKLAQEEEKARHLATDKRRNIPLHYWRGRFVCGVCMDKLVRHAR
jgi:Zn-dependent metalloprotease